MTHNCDFETDYDYDSDYTLVQCLPFVAGKPVGLATNCGKHVLAELKADHVKRNSNDSKEASKRWLPCLTNCKWSEDDLSTLASRLTSPPVSSTLLPLTDGHRTSDPSNPSRAQQLASIDDGVDACQVVPVRRTSRTANSVIEELQLDDDAVEEPKQKKRKLNGWTLHLTRCWDLLHQRAGESKTTRRNRVLAHARDTWADPRVCFRVILFVS